jgi:hypothetical protein
MVVPIPVCVEILLPGKSHMLDIIQIKSSLANKERKKGKSRREIKKLPKITIENPITNTRFNTFPTACVRGATLSRVLVANCIQAAEKENSPYQLITSYSAKNYQLMKVRATIRMNPAVGLV